MFGKSYPLFRILGFEVRLDLTWLILAVLITWSLATGVFPHFYTDLARRTYWAMGVAGTIGLLLSIVFHELSHSVVARRHGLPMKGITLFIFGGVAEMDDEPANARTEFLMAAAGPLASIVLAVALYGVYNFATAAHWPDPINGVLMYLAYLNAVLAIFNLVPAFPLDGGRMLRAALWGWKSNLRWATRLSARIGAGFGIVMIVLGVLSVLQGNFVGGMWWFLIGMFLRGAAHMSYRQMLMRETLKGEPVSRFMKREPVTVPASISIHDFIENYVYLHHFKMFPVMEGSRLLGWVTPEQAREVPRAEWELHAVKEIYQPASADTTVPPDADAVEALTKMNRNRNSRLLVVDGGRLVGIIALKDLMDLLALKMDLEDTD
ncbi:MAG TPA: site-2 protease family protein [Gammaproteobacteria bacterium]|nr:site-2 protease family protein [Gammaproteobacteria bacterium]